MDKETAPATNKPQAASRSSDALTKTNTPRAASPDAPSTTNTRVASQDAPKRQPPKAASTDAPNKRKRSAASKDAMRKATARDAPQQAASRAIPTSSASTDAPPNTSLTERPRSVLTQGDSRSTAVEDAPKTRAASTAAVSERDQTSLAKAPRAGPSNANQWQTVSHKKTTLKTSATAETPKGEEATGVKRKRSMKSRGGKKLVKTNMAPPARAQKRTRPEDSVTPTGVSKKSKHARSRMGDGTSVSYAEAAAAFRSNELCVAIMTEPFMDMTQEQAEGIRQLIENQLRALLKAAPEPTDTTQNTAIHFRGRAHFAEGVLKTWCEDNFTLAWLKGVITNMSSPLPGTKLTVRPQADIPKKVMCMLFVPENSEDTAELHRMLARQNPNLKMNTWTLTHERVRQEPPGTCLFYRVPEPMVKTIKEQQRRVYYLMGSIYIRFLEEGGTREEAAAPQKTTASTAPREELGSPLPGRSPSPPAMGSVGEAVDLATSMAALEVLSIAGSTQDPPSSSLLSDEDCFPQGERSEGEDSSLCSSPVRD